MTPSADPAITRARLLAWGRRAAHIALFLVVTAGGAWLGLLVGGRATADLGPVQTVITVNPRVLGHTVVDIPPLGELDIDSHRGPLGLSVTVQAVDVTEARELLNDRSSLESLGDGLAEDLRGGVVEATVRGLLSAAVGAAIAAAIAYRSTRKAALSAGGDCGCAAGLVRHGLGDVRPRLDLRTSLFGHPRQRPATGGRRSADRRERHRLRRAARAARRERLAALFDNPRPAEL